MSKFLKYFSKIDLSKSVKDRENSQKIRILQNYFETGQVSRRNFMTNALALGASVAAATSVVQYAEASTPTKGGLLRIGITGGATSDILDPGQILDAYMINVQFGQCRNNLTIIGPDGSLVPELAESWEASSDAKTWNFQIMKGVEFHNGKSLTSTDIIDSINHHLGEDSKSAGKALLAGISSVKADGKHGVVVELTNGDADFPIILSDYHMNMCPSNGDGTVDWQSGIGTGGYMLVDHDPGVRTFTKRNPNYWKPDTCYFDEIETLGINDPTARQNALITNSVDCINNVSLKTAKMLKKSPKVTIRTTTGNKQYTCPMLTDVAPFDNKDVRNAIKLCYKRDEWLSKLGYGYGEIGNDNAVGPANQYRATEEELPQRTYDPDQAKFLLKRAGHENLSIKYHAADTGHAGAVDGGSMLRESAKPAGIDIEVVREPNDGYWSNVWMQKGFSACYWSGRPTENWLFTQIYAADASWNDTHWKNPRFNELLMSGRTELNTNKRRDIYVEMQQLLHDDGGLALPIFVSDLLGHNDKIHAPETIANNLELDGHLACERWWFT